MTLYRREACSALGTAQSSRPTDISQPFRKSELKPLSPPLHFPLLNQLTFQLESDSGALRASYHSTIERETLTLTLDHLGPEISGRHEASCIPKVQAETCMEQDGGEV